jgi:hypothetical protein
VSFIDYLEEAQDFDGRVAKFAYIVFQDISNGCGSSKFDAIAWKAHFIDKHPEKSGVLVDLLVVAYTSYVLTIKAK